MDGYDDAIIILEAYDLVDPGGLNIRVPASGNLPILWDPLAPIKVGILGNAVALGPPTPESPLGTFPVMIGPVGSTYESPQFPGSPLPGSSNFAGVVRVVSDQYDVIAPNVNALAIETVFKWVDQCDSGAPDCDPTTIRTATASAAITILEPAIATRITASVPPFCDGAATDVAYSYTVTNAGNVGLEQVVLADMQCLDIQGPFGDVGGPGNQGDGVLDRAEEFIDLDTNGTWDFGEPYIDRNDNGVWDDDEVWTYTCTTTISHEATNVVTVTAHAVGGEEDCGAADADSLTVMPWPVPVASVPDVVECVGTMQQFCGPPGMTSYSWTGCGVVSDQQCVDVPFTTDCTLTLSVVDVNACEGSDSGTLTVNPTPVADVPDMAACVGSVQQFCGPPGMASYSWTGCGVVSDQQCVDAPFTTDCTLTLSVVDANDCMGTDSAALTVNPRPVADVDDSSCAGLSGELCANPSGGTPPYTYLWSPGGETTECITVTIPGMYAVTVTDANECAGNDTGSFYPSVIASVNDATICAGSTAHLCADVIGGTPPFVYMWSTGETAQCIDPTQPGTYTCTVSDSVGCMDPADGTVEVDPLPAVTVDDAAECVGTTRQFCGPPGMASYSWTGCGIVSDQQCVDVTFTTDCTLTLSVVDMNGCEGSDSGTLTANPDPGVDVPDMAACVGSVQQVCGPIGMASYSWTGCGIVSDQQCVDVPFTTDCALTLSVVDMNGCEGSDSAQVTTNPNPEADLADVEACAGSPVTLCCPAGLTCEWIGCGIISDQQCVTLTPVSSCMITATVTDASGCMETENAQLTVNPTPVVNVPDIAACVGSVQQFCGPPGMTSYSWTGCGVVSDQQCVDVTFTTDCMLTLSVMADPDGCEGSDSALLTANANPFVSLPNMTACENEQVTLCPLVLGGTPPYTYLWTPNGETTECINVTDPGTYCVTVTDAESCPGSDCAIVTFIPCTEQPGWNFVNNAVTLTGDQAVWWSVLTGHPAGGGLSPFTVLDPESASEPPGRPALDGTNDWVLRGFVIAWAVDPLGRQIRWNHIAGSGTIVNYRDGYAWEYGSCNYPVVDETIGQGALTGTPGEILLNGIEYAQSPSQLLFNFQAVGSSAYSGPRIAVASTDLTLMPLKLDFTYGGLPVTTRASVDVWNANEVKFSGVHQCVTCWDETLLSQYQPPNHFLLTVLQTSNGKARVRGVQSNACNVDVDPTDGPLGADPGDVISEDSPLLGVVATILEFDGGAAYGASGTSLTGMGYDPAGFIRFGVPNPPQETPLPPPLEVRGSTSRKGSLVIFPKVELRWTMEGEIVQDTFLSLTNDYPENVRVKMYFVNGDPPTGGTSGATVILPGENLNGLFDELVRSLEDGTDASGIRSRIEGLLRRAAADPGPVPAPEPTPEP